VGSLPTWSPSIVQPRGHLAGRGIIWFLAVGIIAGWLAGKLMKGKGFGLVGDLVIGILGAVVDGWLSGLVGIAAWGFIGNIIVAVVGALVLLYVVRMVKTG
jgi:uncharacterized membrane protein YeaQ/YmgE (transglycosylase-associated protein family)